jgi:hypothetical protein
MTTQHKNKFKEFLRACEQPIVKIVIAHLQVIWDDVEEVETNISYAISKGKGISIADGNYMIIPHPSNF